MKQSRLLPILSRTRFVMRLTGKKRSTVPIACLPNLLVMTKSESSLKTRNIQRAMRKLDAEEQQRRNANFSLTDLDGRKWVLKDLRGQVVLVNFWATWCPPCRKEIPSLNLAYDHFKSQGLVILAISEEEPNTLKKFVAANAVRFPVLVDLGNKVEQEAFHASGFPVSFIYDRSGKIVAQANSMPTSERLLEKLKRAGLHLARFSLGATTIPAPQRE